MSCLLVCNTNTNENTDYGIPITIHKSTDYRTTTGTNHRLIPAHPQDFDCSVKSRTVRSSADFTSDINPYSTTYGANYYLKQDDNDPNEFNPLAWHGPHVQYAQTFQEKFSNGRFLPLNRYLSETKKSYPRLYVPFDRQEVFAPEPYALCEIKGLGRDEQPAVRPEEAGYYKHLDPYMTTSRASYVPYSQTVQNSLSRKDITTYWSAIDFPRGGKGYGPKNPDKIEPLVTRRQPLYPDRIMRIKPKLLANYGMKSEYQSGYTKQTWSDFHPYLHENGVTYDDAMAHSSPWQDLVPPGMYCTEQCHIGSGWRVDAVVESRNPQEYKQHVIPPDDAC